MVQLLERGRIHGTVTHTVQVTMHVSYSGTSPGLPPSQPRRPRAQAPSQLPSAGFCCSLSTWLSSSHILLHFCPLAQKNTSDLKYLNSSLKLRKCNGEKGRENTRKKDDRAPNPDKTAAFQKCSLSVHYYKLARGQGPCGVPTKRAPPTAPCPHWEALRLSGYGGNSKQ